MADRKYEQFIQLLLEGLAVNDVDDNEASPEEVKVEPEDVVTGLIDSVVNLTELKTLLCMLVAHGLIKINKRAIDDLFDVGEESP